MNTDLANQAREIEIPEKTNRFVEKFMNLSGVYAVRKVYLSSGRGRKSWKQRLAAFRKDKDIYKLRCAKLTLYFRLFISLVILILQNAPTVECRSESPPYVTSCRVSEDF